MVKKLKYLIFILPFIFITNVKAVQLGTPYVMAHFNDDSVIGPSNATIDSYFNGTNNYYKSPYLMGGVSNQQWINRIDFNYNNANLCVNNDLSISGSIAGIQGMFSDQSYSLTAINNAQSMSCSYSYDWYGTRLNFNCYGQGGGTLSLYLYMNSYSQPVQYTVGVSRDMTVSCDASNLDVIANATQNSQNIINNQNSNTQNIINNQTQNTQEIINNNAENTQDIIDNQNSNTEKEIESQKVCNIIDLSYTEYENKVLNSSGAINNNQYYNVTKFINIYNSTIEKIDAFTGSANLCFYNENKTLISCQTNTNTPVGTLTIPTNSYYVRFSIHNSENRPKYNICKNGNQALNDSVNNLNDTLNSTDTPDTANELSDLDSSLISDTPITDLITLPITLLNSYISGFNSSCSPYNLGNLLGTDLILPCINLQQRLGSNLWTIIDSLFSIFMIYNIAMLFITAFDGFTSLRDDYESLYQPKHADTGYQPKHGGGN